MVDIFGLIKVNDTKTGDLLAKVDGVVSFENIDSIEDLTDDDRSQIFEYLQNKIHPDAFTGNYIVRVELTELADDEDGEKV